VSHFRPLRDFKTHSEHLAVGVGRRIERTWRR